MNPFAVLMVVLNIGAGVYEIARHRDWGMGLMYLCYAVTTAILGTRGGK